MFEKFYPNMRVKSTYDIDFKDLYRIGFRNLIFDIDNTLVCHGAPANEQAVQLMDELKHMGFGILFLSNNKEPRVKMFNEPIGAKYIYKAGKPSAQNYIKGAQILGGTVENTCFVGDQLFTDIWGANKAGMFSILVNPIDKHEEIQIVLKRRLEWIVLKAYERKVKREK